MSRSSTIVEDIRDEIAGLIKDRELIDHHIEVLNNTLLELDDRAQAIYHEGLSVRIGPHIPSWKAVWEPKVQQTLDYLAEHPGEMNQEISKGTGINPGSLSDVLRYLEGQGKIEPLDPSHANRRNIPRKQYKLVGAEVPAKEPKKTAPKKTARRPARRQRPGARQEALLTLIGNHPEGITTKELAEATDTDGAQTATTLKRLYNQGRVRTAGTITRGHVTTWLPVQAAASDAAKSSPDNNEDRETRIRPGEGLSLGRLRGREVQR